MKNTLDFTDNCRKTGLRVTPQRMTIYKVLAETTEHPSAKATFQKARKIIPNISLNTVNRTLLLFRQKGLAITVEGSGDPKRFDANTTPHQHFRCLECKQIIDFHHKAFDKINVPPELARRFKILRKSVYFEGICDTCLSKQPPKAKKDSSR